MAYYIFFFKFESANIDVNIVVNGFQAVGLTSTVTDGMIAECWPSMNSSQHVVGARRDLALIRRQRTG